MPQYAVTVTNPQQIRQAQQLYANHSPRPWLISPPAAAARWGMGWWQQMLTFANDWTMVLDCADSPGQCLSAIRLRIPCFCADLPQPQDHSIRQMAQQTGCRFLPRPICVSSPDQLPTMGDIPSA